ncbi:DNA-binding response regulator [Gordonibacter sp. 28C]|uniref:response regulator transcription factor n=1 Tax=Gordonibacter sp. 28C TaxID=2078569 RepID=UPI000DF7C237|nr:response regulator transcription factor [Gordonibacter sp. 28C]RDB60456.1 DNA-binding response regulator [Gordonibacter sp. 28C]
MDACSILVVEDDPDINALLVKIMARDGFSVVQAFSGTEALLLVEREAFDLVLLDLMLPGMDGADLVARLRGERGLDVPVIVVSARAALSDKVDMLALGADDYVVKPFEPDEVSARVRAVLRRYRGAARAGDGGTDDDPVFVRGALRLETAARRVTLDGVELALTAHEFDILHVLMQAPDKVFSRERLYELVWKAGYYGEENAVNVHVSNIRKKLAAVDSDGEYIKTVWGIGFKLA